MPDLEAGDLYDRLGVSRSASSAEVKRAYLALVREYTPERAPEAFKRIREAYEILSDPGSRNQYDTRPAPHIAALLDQASEAMQTGDFPVAEQLYKKVLLESPGLHWVRNLLGLCLLYQQKAEQAVAQYERLLRESPADASIHGNAGHAYRMAKRFAEAERGFRNAMRIGGDEAVEYGLALIQMLVEAGEASKADALAVTAAQAASAGSPAATEYAAKRIELALILGRRGAIPALLAQMTSGVSTEDHRRNMAFALGKVAGRLIVREMFQLAIQVAKAARDLQPSDPDYEGLELLGRLLYSNDFDGVTRLFDMHVSFSATGWLRGLKPIVQQYCNTHAALKGRRPATTRPSPFMVGCLVYLVVSMLTSVINDSVPFADTTSSSYPSTQRPTGGAGAGDTQAGTALSTLLALAIYDGEAVNSTSRSGLVRSHIRMIINDWNSAPNGYLAISSPLSVSGDSWLRARPDSIRLTTISKEGDTIVWRGARAGETVSGHYDIVGGRYKRQYGTWHLSRTRGAAIPLRVNPW